VGYKISFRKALRLKEEPYETRKSLPFGATGLNQEEKNECDLYRM
jgi:hypothetical protein